MQRRRKYLELIYKIFKKHQTGGEGTSAVKMPSKFLSAKPSLSRNVTWQALCRVAEFAFVKSSRLKVVL